MTPRIPRRRRFHPFIDPCFRNHAAFRRASWSTSSTSFPREAEIFTQPPDSNSQPYNHMPCSITAGTSTPALYPCAGIRILETRTFFG